MNAWTNFSASETLNMFCSLEMFLRWKNAVFVTWEILFSKDKLLSNITPRFLTVEEGTGNPSSYKLWSKRFCVMVLGPISNISVLSEFKRRKLLVIQSFKCLTHSVSLDNLEVSSGFVEIYSWVSSAKQWKWIPYFLIILPRGNMYVVNSRGPWTDPCGTPYLTGDNWDDSPFK